MKTRTKLFWILWISAFIASILILPYLMTVMSDVLKDVPLPSLVLAAIVQGGIVFGLAAFFGLILAERTGFGLPLLTAWLEKKKIRYGRTLVISIILGLIVGAVIVLLDRFAFPDLVTPSFAVPLWQGFLASFYGGIAEEIIMRLFLVSLLVFLLTKLARKKKPSPAMIWSSIIIVAVLFGLGHLPITAAAAGLTPLIVFRAILLNGIGGVVFGWLYWKKGLESAIIAHFSADIVIQIVAPLVF